jgi:hypothetical protein
MKKVVYHGWSKSYSQGPKVPVVKDRPSTPKKELKDCFGGAF